MNNVKIRRRSEWVGGGGGGMGVGGSRSQSEEKIDKIVLFDIKNRDVTIIMFEETTTHTHTHTHTHTPHIQTHTHKPRYTHAVTIFLSLTPLFLQFHIQIV